MTLPLPQVEGIEHRDVTVRGIRLHVAEGGPQDAPPILLLHGWPQHWWMWREILVELARDHRVIAPDLRGLGWSEAPKRGYVKQEMADDNIALLDALGLDRVDLIGHDWGTIVGFLVCLTAPERIGHFLGASVPHLWPPSERPSVRRLLALWYQAALAAPGLGQGLMRQGDFTKKVLQSARVNGRFTDYELAQYADVLKQPERALATAQFYRSFLLHELKPLVAGAFHSRPLQTPTRLLWGRRDPILQGARDDEHRAFAPQMEIEWVPDTGHFLPEERPALVVQRARELFSS
ncbi:alpha/beta fold hydrolase [Conexibacter sp. CPCC 206217]|uniref:alpha/beta fold hydrolase n=1 Tax=Conexibacter sp. CPCC 206217 TaxID=3064574 RepID=UPI00271709BE|nr:alpha/beta fold hydrolase [Conexibacter sp. CPCC 206217]MDO8213255.1 alpha/beta fold hydrolase [Conexibacter sp. CPCC 206217]